MEQLSRLLLQVYIDKVELKTTIENIIQNRFVDEQLVNINGFDLELKEFEDFALEVSDSEIAYGFITKLKIKSSSISGVEGKAKVKLNFSTQFSISEDWQLKTKTYLKEHQWIEKPIMKLKIVSIPTTGLLELLIGAFDDKMCSEIDGLIEKGSDLQKILKPILSNLKNPLQIERISDFNFNIKPQSLNLFLEDHSDKDIKIKIVSEAGLQGKIKAMEATEIISDLPKIRIQDFEPVQSKLHLYSEISHEALSRLVVK